LRVEGVFEIVEFEEVRVWVFGFTAEPALDGGLAVRHQAEILRGLRG
jgi:hypothetical protein